MVSRRLIVAGLILASTLVSAQDVTVLTTTYDIKLSIDGHEYRVSSRALVRSGNEIPNLLQDFKVGLRISEESPDDFLVQVVVYEKDDARWYPITAPPPEFGGKLGTPTEYVWESGGLKLDLAIIVGRYRGDGDA